MNTITKNWLLGHEMPYHQAEIFVQEWPGEMEISEETLLRAQTLGLDLDWFIEEFPLSESVREEYERIKRPFQAQYIRAVTAAQIKALLSVKDPRQETVDDCPTI